MNNCNRRSFLKASGTAGTIALTGLSGCVGGIGGGGGTPTLSLGWVVPVENFATLMSVPDLQEQVPNLGDAYEFESVHHSSTPEGVNALASGETDMTLMTTVSFANAIAQEAVPDGITAFMTDFWDAHDDYYGISVFSGADSDITEPADMEGKKLGVNATGTGIHAVYVKALTEVGLDPENDVEFVELGFPAFTQAIKDGRFDVGVYPALFAVQARGEGFTKVYGSQDFFDPYPFAYNVAANRTLDEKGDAVRAFSEDYVSLLDYARNNRGEVISAAASHFELPEALLDAYFLTDNDYYRDEVAMDAEALNGVMSDLVDLGFIDQQRDYSEFVTTDYMP